MKKLIFLCLFLSFFLLEGICYAQVNRYQIIVTKEETYRIDTSTGKVWKMYVYKGFEKTDPEWKPEVWIIIYEAYELEKIKSQKDSSL